MTLSRIVRACALALLTSSTALVSTTQANNDTWKSGVNANWEIGANWTDGTTPAAADTASLGFASSYTVTFGVAPAAIQNLAVSGGGNVVFASAGGTKTLNVTAGAGAHDLNLAGGTTLTLGNAGSAFNLALGADITQLPFATLNVINGSHLTAADFSTGGLAGALNVSGAGSVLTLTGADEHLIGGSNGNGSLNFQNGTSGALITGPLGLGDALVPASGILSLSGNSSVALTGDLLLATRDLVGSSGSISMTGATTLINQTGTGTVTVGSLNNGSATVSLAGTTNTTLNTGTGGLVIKSTGSVNVGAAVGTGILNANGDVYITGGGSGTGLTVAAGSTYNHAAGKLFWLQSGGTATFNSAYTTLANDIVTVNGANSKLLVKDADFQANNGASVSITNGGTISAAFLTAGTSGDGNITVDGVGSTLAATNVFSTFGLNHGKANLTISNGATAAFNWGVGLAGSIFSDTSATVMVKSGGQLNALSLFVADGSGSSPTATVTVTDLNSSINIVPNGTLKLSSDTGSGVATLNVLDNGSLTVGSGGSTYMFPSSTLNINGGYADLQNLDYHGGTISFVAGSLSFLGDLHVGVGGALGPSVLVNSAKQLSLSGTTYVDPFRTLTLTGGSLTTGDLVVNGGTFNFTGGTLNLTGAFGLSISNGGPFGPTFTLQAGRNLNVSNQTTVAVSSVFALDSGAGFSTNALVVAGELDLNGGVATATAVTMSNSGLIRGDGRIVTTGSNAISNLTGGEIRAENGKRIKFQGKSVPNAGQFNLQGGMLEFDRAITNGAAGQIVGRGTLKVGTTGLTNQGSIALASGITDIFGDVVNNTGNASLGISISGNASVNFWDDVTNTSGLFKVNSGSTATFFGTFSGNGITGNASDIHFEADISPGFSPASVTIAGNVTLGAAAKLKIELGGTTQVPSATFDQVHVGGNLSLDGTLAVSLINSFIPALGNSFDILDWGSLAGTFAAVNLPTLGGGLGWDTSQLYTTGTLSVISVGIPGDYNNDGVVDAADYALWRHSLGQNITLPNDTTPGTVSQVDFDVWRANFGTSSGSGSSLGANALVNVAAVPEPNLLVMLLAGLATRLSVRSRYRFMG